MELTGLKDALMAALQLTLKAEGNKSPPVGKLSNSNRPEIRPAQARYARNPDFEAQHPRGRDGKWVNKPGGEPPFPSGGSLRNTNRQMTVRRRRGESLQSWRLRLTTARVGAAVASAARDLAGP